MPYHATFPHTLFSAKIEFKLCPHGTEKDKNHGHN